MALKRKRPIRKQEDTSNKRHKFQSFSERIERLNIDVLRKVRPVIPDAAEDDEDSYVFSYFSESVKKWRDLNLSATFTDFYRSVLPVSESLPQVIYHQEQIMSLLEEYISRQDSLALTSLLDMLVQFARDLGEDFYAKYWERSVALLSQTVNHADFSAIEAAFNTLSWLLKYLARPLVANLRSTFNQIAPLLGKTRQKQYVRRFASEAFAFLLRRVKEPTEIVKVMLSDIDQNEEFSEAITNVFVESMKAPGNSLHSKALSLFNALSENSHTESGQSIPRGVLEQVLYNTSKDNFSPLLDNIIKMLNGNTRELAIDLLQSCCAVKGGSKVTDWSKLKSPLVDLIDANNLDSKQLWLLAARVVSKSDTITSKTLTQKIFEKLRAESVISKSDSTTSEPLTQRISEFSNENIGRRIYVFCQFVGKLNKSYFQKWVLEEFVKYVNSSDEAQFDELALTILSLQPASLLAVGTKSDGIPRLNGYLVAKESIFIKVLESRLLSNDSTDPRKLWLNLRLILVLGLRTHELVKVVTDLLVSTFTVKSGYNASIAGTLLSIGLKDNSLNETISELIKLNSSHVDSYVSDITYLEGLEKFLSNSSKNASDVIRDSIQSIAASLERNLSRPSHAIREASLRILLSITNINGRSNQDLIEAMLNIEITPRTVENIRSTSLAMRKLPALSSSEQDEMLIAFCFGLLTINFAPLWNDACAVLKVISERSGGKIWEKAFAQLTLEGVQENEDELKGSEPVDAKSENPLDKVWNESQLDYDTRLWHIHDTALSKNSPDAHSNPRSQSLRALLEIPQLAEQHSRDLVPVFLSLESPSFETPSKRWPRQDRISLLTLFTKFTNPRALYQSSPVRSTFYTLLQNGDSKLQLLALDAILTWKDVALVTYRDNLHNLLDDKKFREELTSLVDVDADDSPVQEGHRKELMEVVVRILYGNALVRQGDEGKRAAILSALVNLRPEERRIFIDLALLPFDSTRGAIKMDAVRYSLDERELAHHVDERKMVGFVTMVQNLVKALGGGIEIYMQDLLEPLIVCMWKSRLVSSDETSDDAEIDFEPEGPSTKAARSIRKTAMKVFILLINTCPGFDWERYVSLVFREFVLSKLDSLADENVQSPSARLQFFETLSQHQSTVLFLFQGNASIIPPILQCLENPSASLSVFETVLNVFANIYKFSDEPELGTDIRERLILPHLTNLLEHLTVNLTNDGFQNVVNAKQTLDLITDVLRFSAPFVETPAHAERLIEPLLSLLGKPGRLVNEKIKGGMLESVVSLLPLCGDFRPDARTFDHRLLALSKLFGTLRNRFARVILCQAIDLFAEADPTLAEVGKLVTDLNAYDTRRLDTPDFDRRLAAFGKLNEELYTTLTPRAWTPVAYNLLYFVQDPEEMSLRTGASFGLKRFFTAVKSNNLSVEFTELLSVAVFPAMKKGLKHPSEFVRKEFTGVLDNLVKNCGDWPPISDLKVLLFDGDEEANFFNNIYHIQQHRRLRAITRLSKAAADGLIKPANVEQIFIPMLEKFSLDNTSDVHDVAAEATRGIGVLGGALGWKSYRQLVKRYLGMMKTGDDKERAVVRTVCAVVENAGKVAAARMQRMAANGGPVAVDLDEDPGSWEDNFLVRTVVDEFYPPMLHYLHRHEDSTIALRVPVAIALVKVLHALPEKFLIRKLPAVLTDVCHILKSRSQEARDTCRKTLNDIIAILGPRFFSFVLKELKTALARGYQLHVLGYTVHSLLTHLPARHGELDSCVRDIVDVLVGDVFGVTGVEKDSDGYTTSMKEVKATKSYDSFEVLASITSIPSMKEFFRPLKTFLYEMGSVKDGRKMNEVLRRIQLGLLRSTCPDPSSILDFSLVMFNSIQSEVGNAAKPKDDVAPNQFIVDLKSRRKYETNHFKANASKLLRFALDTIAALVKKHEYLLNDSKISDLVPVIGDCLVSDIDELRIPSLRLLGRIVSLPIASIEEGLEVFVDQAIQFVKDSPLTKSELCQASLKLFSLLIRDRKSFNPTENTVVYLLERIRPDLEEPDRQGVSFSLIRSILSRRFVISEVYDIMNEVAHIMITNQSRSVRDTTRALYLQFLMDYPQGRDRLKKQISFLVKNLEYVHETGRQSVMEVLHQVISKFGDELLQPILLDLFVGLLLPLINDESPTCREMASRLLESIIESADDERSKSVRTMLRLWARQAENAALLKASLHVYAILLEHGTKATEDFELCVECTCEIILQSGEDARSQTILEVTEHTLQLFAKLIKVVPSQVFTSDKESVWEAIRKLLMSENLGVRLVCTRLFGMLFGRAKSLARGDLRVESLSLRVPNLTALTRQFVEQIKSPDATSEISLQTVKNLIFLGRHFYETNCPLPSSKAVANGEETDIKTCLSWLISRVAAEIRYEKMVAEHVGHSRKLFVQWMVAMISVMNSDKVLEHAEPIIASLSRFTDEAPTASILKSALKDTREIAEEGLKLIQTKVGTTAYLEIFNTVRQDVIEKRRERKMKRSLEVVTDPERAARKKIRHHEKAKDSRKRKVEKFKADRLKYGK